MIKSLLLDRRHVPRAILVDLESGVFDAIKEKEFGRLFEPDSFIAGSQGAGKNWAKGYYSEGLELSSKVLERIRLVYQLEKNIIIKLKYIYK